MWRQSYINHVLNTHDWPITIAHAPRLDETHTYRAAGLLSAPSLCLPNPVTTTLQWTACIKWQLSDMGLARTRFAKQQRFQMCTIKQELIRP